MTSCISYKLLIIKSSSHSRIIVLHEEYRRSAAFRKGLIRKDCNIIHSARLWNKGFMSIVGGQNLIVAAHTLNSMLS